MKRKIIVTVMSLMFSCLAYAQQSRCYSTHRDKGVKAYEAGKYEEAKKHFAGIRKGVCVSADIPANNDLDDWLEKCDRALQEEEKAIQNANNKYDEVFYFSEGLAYVKLNGKWIRIDKTGNEVSP